MPAGIVGRRYWIGVVFFLLTAAPGCWVPVLSNAVKSRGWDGIEMWAFLMVPAAAIISPLLFAARADQRYRAEHVLGVVMAGGAGFLFLAFRFLEHGETPAWFLVFFGMTTLVSAPAWPLLNAVALRNLEDSELQITTGKALAVRDRPVDDDLRERTVSLFHELLTVESNRSHAIHDLDGSRDLGRIP